MKKFLNSIATAAITIILAACTPKIQYVLITPDDNLIQDCEYVIPVDQLKYLRTSVWTDREEMLFSKLGEGDVRMQKCNNRIRELREWKIKQKQIWEKQNGPKPSPGADSR